MLRSLEHDAQALQAQSAAEASAQTSLQLVEQQYALGTASALQLLTAFYAAPHAADPEATLAALRQHMEQVAFHHNNVAQYATPELEF